LDESKLTDQERAVYEWQLWSPEFGEGGQARLKAASVLVTRCAAWGTDAFYLAADRHHFGPLGAGRCDQRVRFDPQLALGVLFNLPP